MRNSSKSSRTNVHTASELKLPRRGLLDSSIYSPLPINRQSSDSMTSWRNFGNLERDGMILSIRPARHSSASKGNLDSGAKIQSSARVKKKKSFLNPWREIWSVLTPPTNRLRHSDWRFLPGCTEKTPKYPPTTAPP